MKSVSTVVHFFVYYLRTLQSHREKMTPHPAVIQKNASQDASEDDQALDVSEPPW